MFLKVFYKNPWSQKAQPAKGIGRTSPFALFFLEEFHEPYPSRSPTWVGPKGGWVGKTIGVPVC
ncbi:hypothetical protein MPNT_170015 [Candidatus Methylacidithermus pantelleriae]|uniref:Uncharacterized protein n=1 Tax=Candidatus Methylacidithermus pantelleriae TaxID=2744239 RepID=A0A8J2BNS8_9BACT|nr:hypothetical protein MPNT_170015 [Candidatus Methylacidithermus pantelleriae]